MNSVQAFSLLPSAARTATGTGDAVLQMGAFSEVGLELDITAAATDAGDTLDVFVQTQFDGTNWVDICHFTQALGNGGAKRFFSKIFQSGSLTEFDNATALAAANARALPFSQLRIRWAIVDAGTANASFTFSVTGNGVEKNCA